MRIATLLLALATVLAAAGQTAVNIARQYAGSVVTILTEDANHQSLALGSGFVVGNGKVVTNYHVVEGARYATAISANGGKFQIDGILGHSGLNDLAVLSVPGLNGSVTLSTNPTEVGERVYAIGSPEGLSNSISEGIVSGNRKLNGVHLIQITAAISPGSSGGPVINEKGAVIGVAVGAISSGQSLNFAIPSALISPLLAGSIASPLNTLLPRKSTTTESGPTSAEAITVAELDLEPYYGDQMGVIIGHTLEGISLKNNTNATIAKVKLIIILYNAKGTPLDYVTLVLCESGQHGFVPKDYDECGTIPSGLSKYYKFNWLRNSNHDSPRAFDRRKGEKLVVRILDAEVIHE